MVARYGLVVPVLVMCDDGLLSAVGCCTIGPINEEELTPGKVRVK